MAKRNTQFDSTLIVYTKRRLKLYALIVLGMIGLTLFFSSPWKDESVILGGTLILVGLVYSAFPMTEKWQYKAWQDHPSLFEQDLHD